MSLAAYFRHVDACNSFDPRDFLPFYLGGRRMGRIARSFAPALSARPEVRRHGEGFALIASDTAEARTQALDHLMDALIQDGMPMRRRGERFPVILDWGDDALASIDRGAVAFFGVRAFGVHLNVTVDTPDGPMMWLGRRSRTKPVAPGRLDNLVAGGQPYGLTLKQNLAKEAEEEAGITAPLIGQARPVGAISYKLAGDGGSRDDVLFVYDLSVPDSFRPLSRDGEHEGFMRLPIAEVIALLQQPDEFKFNVNLVLIDYLVRHGHIPPDEPGYLDLVKALRR